MRNLVLAHAMSTEEFDGEHQRLAAELRKPKRVSYDPDVMESVLSWFHGAFMTDSRFEEMDSSELAQDLLVLSADLGPIEPPGLLYRYLWMSPEDARTLRHLNGSHVVKVSVGSKELSSWTGSLDAAKQFRSIGVQDEQPGDLGLEEVIIGAKIPSKNILLSWKALMAFVDAQVEAWKGAADGDDYEEAQRILKWFGKQDEYVVNTMGGVIGDVDYMDVRDPRGPTYQSTWENKLDKTSAMKPVNTDLALPGGLSVYQALDEVVYWFVGDYMHGYEPLGSPRGLPVLLQALKDLRRFFKIQSPGQLYRYLWMSPEDAEFLAANKGKMSVKLSTGDKPLMSWTDDLDTAREFQEIGSKRGVEDGMMQVIVGGKFPASRIILSHESVMAFLDDQMAAWEGKSVSLDYKGRKGDAGAARNEVHYYNSFRSRIDSYEDQREFVVLTEGGVVDRVNYLETYEGAMSTEDMDPLGWDDEEEGSWETRLDVKPKPRPGKTPESMYNYPKSSSLAKVATVKHCPGHENSKGEAAPWCIIQEGTGKTLSSHKTEAEAREHLKQIEMHKHMASGKTASYWCDAAAGCLCVALSTGRVLLSKRGPDCDNPGTWTTVGGAVDGDETPLEACEREFHEETGYEGEAVFTEVFKDETPEFTYTTFLCFVEDEFDAVSLPEFADENAAFEWFEWGEWPEPLHPKFEEALPDLEPVIESAVVDLEESLGKAASYGPHPDPLTHMPTNGPQGHHLKPAYTSQNRLLEPDEEQQEKLEDMIAAGTTPANAQTMQITSAETITDFSFLNRDPESEPLREFLRSLTNWLSGNYMEKDQDPEELILGAETFVGGSYGDTELFRFCYLTAPEMEAVKAAKAQGAKVSVRTARRDLQSWSGSAKGAKHFAHTYYVEQGASPSKPAGAEFVILGAAMPGDKILVHMEDVGRWLAESKDPVLDEKMTLSQYSATWRTKILNQMSEFEGEDEWLVRPGDAPLPVKHLELGEEDAEFWDDDEPKDAPYIWKSSMLNKVASWREMDDNDCETVMEWFLGYFMVQSRAQSGMFRATKKLGLSYPDTQLYRYCWVPVRDLKALMEADSVKVRTNEVSKAYQSWTDDHGIALEFGKSIGQSPTEHDRDLDVTEDDQGEDVSTESGYSGVVVGTVMDAQHIVLKAQDLRDQLESWYQAHHRGEDAGETAASPAAIRNLLDTLRTYTEGGRMDQHEYICKPRYEGVRANYLDWDKSTVGHNMEGFTPPRVDKRSHKVAYVEQELGWLKSYLTMPDADKGDELLRHDPYEFEQFARRTGLMDDSVFEDEEWYLDDSVLDAIPDPVKAKFLGAWHSEGSDVPLFTIADYEGLVKDQWLVHFTDHPAYIARDGFTKGVALDEWEKLGLSTHFRSRASRPGFNFAYTFQDADEHEGATRYGKECVMFKASGVKIWHHGDQEDQVIFIGATAHDIVPIYRHDEGWYVEGVGPNKEFVTPDLDSMMNWVRDNYDQYRNVLSKKPTRRVIPETKRSSKTASMDAHEAARHARVMDEWVMGDYAETPDVQPVLDAVGFFRPALDMQVPETLYRMMFLSKEDVEKLRHHEGKVSVKTGVLKPLSSWTPSLRDAKDFYEISVNLTSGDDRPEVAVVLEARLPKERVVWQKSAYSRLMQDLIPKAQGADSRALVNSLDLMADEGLDVGDEFLLMGDPERVYGLYTLRGETLWDDQWVEEKWASKTASRGELPRSFDQWLSDNDGFEGLNSSWGEWMETYYQWAAEDLGDLPDDEDHLKQVEEKAREFAEDELSNQYHEWMYKYRELQFPLMIYRALSINGLEDLKTDGVGVYWSDDPDCAVPHWGGGAPTYVLEGEIQEDAVDWPSTLNVNMDPGTGEDEQEIRLKPGARVRVVRVKRLGERVSDKDTVETTEEMEMTAKVAAEEPNERVEFMQFITRWYDGTYMGKADVPELLRKGLRDNVPPSEPKELHRFCYLDRDDVQALKSNNGNVKLRSAARPLQSWAESREAVEVFARDAVGGDSEFPSRPGEAVFVIISAQIPTSAILATPETLKAWVGSCEWPEMDQPWHTNDTKTWRESLASLLVLYKEEQECIVDLSDSTVEVTGLLVGHELMTEDYDYDGDEYERPEYPYWDWKKEASKVAWGKKPAPKLDAGDLSVLDLWVAGSYTHHQGGVGQHLQAIKAKLGLSYGPVTLYRACWLPEDQARPMDGSTAPVDASHAGEYQSWTGSPDKAREFHDRFLGDPKPGFSKVILQAQMSGPEVVFRFSDVQKAIVDMPLSRELTDALQACKGAAAFDEYVCHLPGPVRASVSVPKRAEWKRSPITVPQVYQGRRDPVAPKTGSIAWQPTPTIEVAPGKWIAPVSKKGTYFTKQNFPKQQALVTPRPGTPGFYFVRIGCVTELWGQARDPRGLMKTPLGLEVA